MGWTGEILAKKERKAEWRLIGSISTWGDINPKEFNRDISKLEASNDEAELIIHCPGGSVFDGLQIFNRMNSSKLLINTNVEGLAASMGSVLAMAGTHRKMASTARIMIHQGTLYTKGSGNELIEQGKRLNQINETLAEIYAEAISHKHPERDKKWVLENWMVDGKDKWFTATQALEAGLVHEVYTGKLKDIPVKASFDEVVAFYDNSLVALAQKNEGKEQPKGQNDNQMKKEQLLLMLAGLGITFENVTAESDDDAFNSALKGKIAELQAKAKNTQALQARIDELEGNQLEDELDKAVLAGKISETQKGHYQKMADSMGKDAVVAALQEINVPSADIPTKKRIPKQTDSPIAAGREKWNLQAWEKHDPEGLEKLIEEDEQAYQALLDSYDPEAEPTK
jgi:ATP-dependent protease ClpP protease subunit